MLPPINVFSESMPVRPDGLHAFYYSTNFGLTRQVRLWHTMRDPKAVELLGTSTALAPWCQLAGPKLFVADIGPTGGIKILEYVIPASYADGEQWEPSSSFYFGDSTSEYPVMTVLVDGSVFCASYRHDGSVTLDIAYHSVVQGADPALPTNWVVKTFQLVPGPIGIPSVQLARPIQGVDGLIYVFFARDSSHHIHLVRFRISGSNIELVDFNDAFCSDYSTNGVMRDGLMSPDGEFPFVSASPDPDNGRILICYCQSRRIYQENNCETICTHPVLVAVKPDLSKSLVCTADDAVNRSLTPIALMPKRHGAACVYSWIDPNCDNPWRWKGANISGSHFKGHDLGPAAYQANVALSVDGWCALRRPDNSVELIQV